MRLIHSQVSPVAGQNLRHPRKVREQIKRIPIHKTYSYANGDILLRNGVRKIRALADRGRGGHYSLVAFAVVVFPHDMEDYATAIPLIRLSAEITARILLMNSVVTFIISSPYSLILCALLYNQQLSLPIPS